MSQHREERLLSSLQRLTAEFLSRQTGQQSMITVTGYTISSDGQEATALISVYPDSKETAALDFVRRQCTELRAFVKANLQLRQLPHFNFAIDEGEKYRQKIDNLLK